MAEDDRPNTTPDEDSALQELRDLRASMLTATEKIETARADAENAMKRAKAAEAKAERARADAEKAKKDADEAKLAAKQDREKTEAAEARAKIAEQTQAEAEAEKAMIQAVNNRLVTARVSAVEARDDAEKRLADLAKESDANQPKLGIRQFVSKSLLDIMAGVDEAAAMGKTRALNGDGLDDLLASATTIGATIAEGRTSDRVEFDLAVTVARSADKETSWGIEVQAEAKASLLNFLKLGGGIDAQYSRAASEAISQQQAHRLRFSVPIAYAVQDGWANED